MEFLKPGLDNLHKLSIQTSVVNIHAVNYTSIASADNTVQLQFACCGHSDNYIDLNSVRLLFRIKIPKTDANYRKC